MSAEPGTTRLSRRAFLAAGPLAVAGCRAARQPELGIRTEVLESGRAGGRVWFHPRPCLLGNPDSVLMTLQSISGSDFYGPVHWTRSDDRGRSWTTPVPLAGFGRRQLGGGLEEGICDVVPQLHPQAGKVIAMGHNVYYRGGRLTRPYRDRWPVYAVGDGKGAWSARQRLVWDHPGTSGIYTCGCGERLVLENGDLLIPVSFGPVEREHRRVTTLRCAFDGATIRVLRAGTELGLAEGRGLLEPSVVRFGGRFRMTIRAEDGRGYHSISMDGLGWEEQRPWCFDDGTALVMSTTQQHWLVLGGALWLVYTRKDPTNGRVMRYRAPLYIARVDPGTMALVRASERVVLPLRGDPRGAPRDVALMGNFHTLALCEREGWVTVGENRPSARYRGDLLLARITLR